MGNTHELQNGRSPARNWFMKMAASVNERVTKGVTSQGFYVATADGKGYGFNNNRSVERVNWFMDNAVKKMRDDPPQVVAIPQSEIDAPFARSPGEGTSVLRIFTRISPVPTGSHKSNNAVARDHVWIYKNEVLNILDTSKKTPAGQRFPLSKVLVGRLLRFHLVDNVRGEPNFWRPEEIKKAEFTCSMERGNGPSSVLRIAGSFEMQTANGARGMIGKLEGKMYVVKNGEFDFKAYAEATAWGGGTYTPNPPAGKFPIKFAVVQVNDAASKIVTPQAATWAGEYENPGLK